MWPQFQVRPRRGTVRRRPDVARNSGHCTQEARSKRSGGWHRRKICAKPQAYDARRTCALCRTARVAARPQLHAKRRTLFGHKTMTRRVALPAPRPNRHLVGGFNGFEAIPKPRLKTKVFTTGDTLLSGQSPGFGAGDRALRFTSDRRCALSPRSRMTLAPRASTCCRWAPLRILHMRRRCDDSTIETHVA